MKDKFVFGDIELASIEEMRKEATRCLSKLCSTFGLDSQIVETWNQGIVTYSPPATHSEIATKYNFQPKEIIREFEVKYNCIVYHVLQNDCFLTMLFVDPYKDDWHLFDEVEIPNRMFGAYVYNILYPQLSEMGEVGICSTDGTLIRII